MLKRPAAFLIMITLFGVVLVGCGRKGALEPPPSIMIENEKGEKHVRPQKDTPFILDRLIRSKK